MNCHVKMKREKEDFYIFLYYIYMQSFGGGGGGGGGRCLMMNFIKAMCIGCLWIEDSSWNLSLVHAEII